MAQLVSGRGRAFTAPGRAPARHPLREGSLLAFDSCWGHPPCCGGARPASLVGVWSAEAQNAAPRPSAPPIPYHRCHREGQTDLRLGTQLRLPHAGPARPVDNLVLRNGLRSPPLPRCGRETGYDLVTALLWSRSRYKQVPWLPAPMCPHWGQPHAGVGTCGQTA